MSEATAQRAATPTEERAQPLEERARVAVVLIGLVMLAAIASLWADLSQYGVLGRIVDGERVTLAELETSDDRVATTAIIYTVALFTSAVTFLLWYSRAYRNIAALGVTRPRYGRKWAVAYWFIPIMNLFRPKQVMNDIWRGSDPEMTVRTVTLENRPVPGILHWWWGVWLLSGILGNLLFRASFDDAATPEDLRNESAAYAFADMLEVVVGALAIVVVRRTTARQEERRRRFETAALPGQADQGPPAGWYPDPEGGPNPRWWDGTAWTGHFQEPGNETRADP